MSNLTFDANSSLVLDFDFPLLELQLNVSANSSNSTAPDGDDENYWALVLVVFPFLTLFGNVLVILSVYRERTLQSATNYFIVSLAFADLLVAVLVMPFAVYVLVNGHWGLPPVVCDFYIAMDVTCSTSSIFNLVAISIDRYIAVTQPIKYAKHKNTRRVWLTIVLVWAISAAIGSPIVLGLNNTPERVPDLCVFYNADFIIYSSLSSFYIPCIIMVFLYYSIFKALRDRAKKHRAKSRVEQESRPALVYENVAQTRPQQRGGLAETAMVAAALVPTSSLEDGPTNTGSGSPEDDDEGERSPGSDAECHVIPNDKSTEFIMSAVIEEKKSVRKSTVAGAPAPSGVVEEKGNNDSGYAASQLEEGAHGSPPASPMPPVTPAPLPHPAGAALREAAPISAAAPSQPAAHRPLTASLRAPSEDEASTMSTSRGKRFTINKVNKASRKKREKSFAKKERKATKTLAIVLGVFLFCWVPFFSCNVMDAVCTKLGASCNPSLAAFIITTWLGYMNSFVNPVIYTIFNPEFRKAFKKLMGIGT